MCSGLLQMPLVTITKVLHPSRWYSFLTPTPPRAKNPLKKGDKCFLAEQAWKVMGQNIQFDKCTTKSASLLGYSNHCRSFLTLLLCSPNLALMHCS